MDQEYITTPFDLETQSRDIQILKTAIPYIPGPAQKTMAVMVKYMELNKIMRAFGNDDSSLSICSSNDPAENSIQMLTEIKKLCTPKEQENIDMLLNVMQMFSFL